METGFRRMTWVFSVALAAFVLLGLLVTNGTALGAYIITPLFAFAAPWGAFYAARWIISGFCGGE